MSSFIPSIEEQIRLAIIIGDDEKALNLAKMFGYNEEKCLPTKLTSLVLALGNKKLFEGFMDFTNFYYNRSDFETFYQLGKQVHFDQLEWVIKTVKKMHTTLSNHFIFGTWFNTSIPIESTPIDFENIDCEMLKKILTTKCVKSSELLGRTLDNIELIDDLDSDKIWGLLNESNYKHIVKLYIDGKIELPRWVGRMIDAMELCDLESLKLIWNNELCVKVIEHGVQFLNTYYVTTNESHQEKCKFVLTEGSSNEKVIKAILTKCSMINLIELHNHCDVDAANMCKYLNTSVDEKMYLVIKHIYKNNIEHLDYLIKAYNLMHHNSVVCDQKSIAFNKSVYDVSCAKCEILKDTDFVCIDLFECENKKYSLVHDDNGDVALKDEDGNISSISSGISLVESVQKRMLPYVSALKPKKSAKITL
jgi:hypothetical protein